MERPINTDTLVADVIEAIETGIRQGHYLPGDQLVERDLAKELGVSRSPVREALRRLAAQHILEIRPHRGAVVRALTRQEAAEVLDILTTLGRLSVSRAAQRIGENDNRKRLLALLKRERAYKHKQPKVGDWVHLNSRYHQLIAEISGNPLLPGLFNQFQLQMFRLWSDVHFARSDEDHTVGDHLDIAEAILDGDVRGTLRCYNRHVKHTLRAFEALPNSAFAGP